MTIGTKIKNIRIAHNMTQSQLSELSGISLPSIRKYESEERNPKPEQLLEIAKALGVSINVFIEFDINTVSDLLSLILRMTDQAGMTIHADTDSTGNYIPDTVTLSVSDPTVNQKLCTYLLASQKKLELEQKKDSYSATEYESQLEIINNELSDLGNILLDDNTLLNTEKITPAQNESADPKSHSIYQEWLNLLQDCSPVDIEFLFNTVKSLKENMQKIK